MKIPPELFEETTSFRQMTLEEAIAEQFKLCDTIQRHFGSDEIFTAGDFGQDRSLAVLNFAGGGRPKFTALVEETLADYFGVEDVTLVQSAGTGSIRAMLTAMLKPGDRIVLHKAHIYKTTKPIMEQMGFELHYVDFNSIPAIVKAVQESMPKAVYIQRVTQQLGDKFDTEAIIEKVKKTNSETLVLADDNYAIFRAPFPSTTHGADATSFSLFKLLAGSNIGCVLSTSAFCGEIRRNLSSAGCQVSGVDAMEAMRSLVYVPVALAIQKQTVEEVVKRVNHRIEEGDFPLIDRAYSMSGIRCVMLHFKAPVAEKFLKIAWKNGSPSRSVGEESRHELIPLFTYCLSSFLKGNPGLKEEAIRINPFRAGPDTVMRILKENY